MVRTHKQYIEMLAREWWNNPNFKIPAQYAIEVWECIKCNGYSFGEDTLQEDNDA